jgi:hypothetical protein
MKEKPILFSQKMIHAILNTKPNIWPAEPIDPSKPFKWVTRRVVKPQPENPSRLIIEYGKLKDIWRGAEMIWQSETLGKPPYREGDVLWVRETFTKSPEGDYIYRADPIFDGCGKGDIPWKWTSPLFLPREATRLFLEVKNIRVERVQDITEEDSRAEGVLPINPLSLQQIPNSLIVPGGKYKKGYILYHSYRAAFYKLWESLNAKRGYFWESNPWVYVYEFMRVNDQGKGIRYAKEI